MLWRVFVVLFVGVLLELQLTQCAPPAKGRAYEFGFEIDQNQHRHEKRDGNGIVMGEFGFITADGIYHVTVYATDEDGRFKILAMKSYPYGNREKKIMITMMPAIKKTVAVPAIVKAMPTDTKSCGGCIITKKYVPQPASVAAPLPGAQVFKPTPPRPSSIPLPPRLPSVPSLQLKPNVIGATQLNGKPLQPFGQIPGNRQNKAQGTPQQFDVRLGSPNKAVTAVPRYPSNQPSPGGAQTSTSKLPSTQKITPTSQSIGKTTPSNNGGGPLYRFNYVLDYNSHREEGRLDGSKEGNYKTIGEDGIRRIIDYIANENGFQPHIKWEPVPPNELPTGANKLKEYEFVWFN